MAVVGAVSLPPLTAGRHAHRVFEGDESHQHALAQAVAAGIRQGVDDDAFHTSIPRFDGEWVFGTHMMGAMGLGQVALAHPQTANTHRQAMGECIDQLLTARVRAFDRAAWGSDALDTLDTHEGHVAYLGYLNLALSLHRQLDPGSRFAALNDRITAALVRRYEASEIGLLETYPGEIYPVDNLAAIGGIGLYSRVVDPELAAVVQVLVARIAADYLDHETGLLVQAVTETGLPADDARGSGTALGAYFASWASPELARTMHGAIRQHLARAPLGFGMVREYTHDFGHGDIDSGPVVAGFSVSATGFSLGSARVAGDFEHFERVYRTAHLFGAPHSSGDRKTFATGGALGNAIMLAMLTAPRAGEPE